ncbi:hypothetical protein Pcinc_018079 [Petrolisthes cinctipes]|uniref:Uncharacterized protein n=1 Tax=Petrolisthes cinctipes TaxID=88211 RepID=A0AAE1KMV6_PETCI|nr:hypothetical protein Pcinc_018079 [Petrolisthes cinctipes]
MGGDSVGYEVMGVDTVGYEMRWTFSCPHSLTPAAQVVARIDPPSLYYHMQCVPLLRRVPTTVLRTVTSAPSLCVLVVSPAGKSSVVCRTVLC